METLLDDLASMRWDVASHTFGNSHATLIGLLVSWWIKGNPKDRWALDGGPSYGYRARMEKGNGQCDAVLGEGATSRGIIEVEGTRHAWTIEKLGRFFAAEYPEFESLEFAIFLAYGYAPTGKGANRAIPTLPLAEYVTAATAVSAQHPEKRIAVLTLDKAWEPQPKGSPRARSEFYWGRPSTVRGVLLMGGEQVAESTLYPAGA